MSVMRGIQACDTPLASDAPCIKPGSRKGSKLCSAVAEGCPGASGVLKPVAEHGAPSAGSVIPNGRKGRIASLHVQGREKNLMFVGIDISKDRLDVHLRLEGEAFAVARDSEGLEALATRLLALKPELVVLEVTGGFETVVAAGLAAAGLPLAVVNPRQIRDFARAVGRLAKTAPLDAAVIAHFAEAVRPQTRAVPDDASRVLGELVARRRQIIEMMVAEGNRRRLMTQRGPSKIARESDECSDPRCERHQNRLFANAFPEPVLKYFSSWRAFSSVCTAT